MLHWVYKRYTTNLFSMPSPTDETEVKTKFYELAHFPGVLGLVDGTHIRIQKPSENEADYVIRHFYHSIYVQAICQPDGRFSDVLARFPGSVHDFRMWKLSQVGIHIENSFSTWEHILGDSGYMLRPYLLTPYQQTFGRWKRRFHCLLGEIRMTPEKCLQNYNCLYGIA